ncbi:hypothetical protein BT96DRAFT_1018287 [Gymnopus androsaceus JB14]|uniref:Uncharacterized protein n=1 Tax=Gymnopus androsaceus JB14 TaxID=1447944 RepID=A0A6A4HQ86_9AGAR|nr:hypothetical protein BT96DRAFT_1018287 [Gymnopus androsaceus JB14]
MVQAELDDYMDLMNSTKRRAQKNKNLPHGPPDDIDEHPEDYQALNFKASKKLYAPPDHPVFDLVPPQFNYWITQWYQQIGSPVVTRHNVWNVYEELLHKFETNAPLLPTFQLGGFQDDREEFVKEVEGALNVNIGLEVEDLQSLLYDEESGYMGGAQGGLGPNIEDSDLADGIVHFSSDEESNNSDDNDSEGSEE